MNTYDGIVRTLQFPSIHKIELCGLPPEHTHMKDWGWVNIHDLRGCLSFLDTGLRASCAKDIFDRYGLACNKEEDYALFTWITENGYVVDSREEPPFDSARIHVPSGWAKRILKLANSGIVRLTSSPTKAPKRDSFGHEIEGETEIIHQRVGHKTNGEKIIVIFNGESGRTTDEARVIARFNC